VLLAFDVMFNNGSLSLYGICPEFSIPKGASVRVRTCYVTILRYTVDVNLISSRNVKTLKMNANPQRAR